MDVQLSLCLSPSICSKWAFKASNIVILLDSCFVFLFISFLLLIFLLSLSFPSRLLVNGLARFNLYLTFALFHLIHTLFNFHFILFSAYNIFPLSLPSRLSKGLSRLYFFPYTCCSLCRYTQRRCLLFVLRWLLWLKTNSTQKV